jgi:tetrapyrrole methylase family protein/MazG family protein
MDDFRKLVDIMARLRAEGGCEWDRAQTHETLRQYLVEETHEVIDAIRRRDPALLCEELGDLLLQVLFHAQVADEHGEFDIHDVISSITEKMIRRHPHVFGNARADDPEAVAAQWEHIKRTVENRSGGSIVGGVPRDFPSLLRAVKMSRKAARAGFDWERPEQVVEKVEEEIAELKEAMADGQPDRIEHELGDTLLALANLARFLRIDPEVAMIAANDRFERRFREMERIAAETGISIEQSDMRTLDRLWEQAKRSTSPER